MKIRVLRELSILDLDQEEAILDLDQEEAILNLHQEESILNLHREESIPGRPASLCRSGFAKAMQVALIWIKKSQFIDLYQEEVETLKVE